MGLQFDYEFIRNLYDIRMEPDAPRRVGQLMRHHLGYAAGNFTYHVAGRRAEDSTFRPAFFWANDTEMSDAAIARFRDHPFKEGSNDDKIESLLDVAAVEKAIILPRPAPDGESVLVTDGEMSFRSLEFWIRHNAARDPTVDAFRAFARLLGLLEPITSARLHRLIDWVRTALGVKLHRSADEVLDAVHTLIMTRQSSYQQRPFGINVEGHLCFRMVYLPSYEDALWLPPGLVAQHHPCSDFQSCMDRPDTDRSALVVPIALPLDQRQASLNFRVVYYGSHVGISKHVDELRATEGVERSEWYDAFLRSLDAVALSFMSAKVIFKERSAKVTMNEAVGHEFKNIASVVDIKELSGEIKRDRHMNPDLRRWLMNRLPLILIPEGLGAFLRVWGKSEQKDLDQLRENWLTPEACSDPDAYRFDDTQVRQWSDAVRWLFSLFFRLHKSAYKDATARLMKGLPGGAQTECELRDVPDFNINKTWLPPTSESRNANNLKYCIISMMLEPFRNAMSSVIGNGNAVEGADPVVSWDVHAAHDGRSISIQVCNPIGAQLAQSSGSALVDELGRLVRIGYCALPQRHCKLYQLVTLYIYPQFFGTASVPSDLLVQ